jgi:hypothetical protein
MLSNNVAMAEEEDIFDSDFGSTESDTEGEDDEAGEKQLARAEKEARKVREKTQSCL